MKTLYYTCIYNGLFETKLGGRPSRERHYKNSLLNILNISYNKFICFTSKEEKEDLELFFYHENGLNIDDIEFIEFDLKNNEYHKRINAIKKIDKNIVKDRCYEIQYNKFLFLNEIENLDDYDYVFWIDAGLSYHELFPETHTLDKSIHGRYKVVLFDEKFTENMIDKSKEKVLLIAKNNKEYFYWSNTIPEKYYNEYSKDIHIIGGFFGGKTSEIIKFKNMFTILLNVLLKNEKELFMEEQIMSNIYFNNKNMFKTLNFDDWKYKDWHKKIDSDIKLFYQIF